MHVVPKRGREQTDAIAALAEDAIGLLEHRHPGRETSRTSCHAIASSVAVGSSSMSARMRSFHKLISFFKTPCTITGLHVAPTAPCSIEYVSSGIEAESFHRQVGVACVIS